MSGASAETHHVQLGSRRQVIKLRRSCRRTLGVVVHPDASVVVTAPQGASTEAVLRTVEGRAAWILGAIRDFERFLPRTPPRRHVAGETHLFLGREYRLAIDREGCGVRRETGRLIVGSASAQPNHVGTTLRRWYGRQARMVLDARLDAGLPLFAVEGVRRPALTIRRLDKRWGSMSNDGTCMLLNTRLVEADRDEIDYVIAHELAHIVEPHHGPAFHDLLTRKMPDWRRRKLALEHRFA